MAFKAGCFAITTLALCSGAAFAADVPAGYPANYADIIKAAEEEGKVVVFSPTEEGQIQPLLKAFSEAYPKIRIEWNDISVTTAFNRVISEAAAGQTTSDFVWGNAMDLQLKLVSMGNAEEYVSPEVANLPDWAKYQDSAWSTTVEPAVLIYNKGLMPVEKLPTTHAELLDGLQKNKAEWTGKVATFDPEKSGAGFLWMRNNDELDPQFWELVKAFGAADGKVYSSSGQFREKVLSGELLFAFDMNGAYAQEWVKGSSNLGLAFFKDYTQTQSRVAILTKNGPHPNAAKLLLDFMLSKKGQEAASQSGLPSVRSDIEDIQNIETLNEQANGNLKPLPLNEALLEKLEPKSRVQFLAQWKKALRN